jgi:hypothetical protein
MTLKYTFARLVLTPFLMVFLLPAGAQMITGVWKGKINRQKVEVKIIQQGDSLLGTSYYYESANNYRRYSIRGYFDATTNQAVWWDDQLIDEKSGRLSLSAPGKNAMLSSADFNCPGSGKMLLDGKTGPVDDERPPRGDVNLEKVPDPVFPDEWDFVIDNYTVGANDPDIIDSIAAIAGQPPIRDEPVRTIPREDPPVLATRPPITTQPVTPIETPREQPKPVVTITEPARPQTIEEKFTNRRKILTTEIPLSGDSIELRFYDNAEIDGDSISLFLNEKLVFSHIRLTGNAYTIKLAVSELQSTNELIMVAENLGSIPPNTSYMVAIVNQQRYEARLESTEGSSAMVRFVKK